MANTNTNKKSFLNILLIILVAICVVLLVIQISTDTLNEIQSNEADEGYAVHLDIVSGRIQNEAIPTPTPGVALPTPTYDDITHGE